MVVSEPGDMGASSRPSEPPGAFGMDARVWVLGALDALRLAWGDLSAQRRDKPGPIDLEVEVELPKDHSLTAHCQLIQHASRA